MVSVMANIKLSKEVTVNCNTINSGFRITIKIGNNGYITQLFSVDEKDILLDIETTVKMDILCGEIEIEKIIDNTSFEFVSGKVLGKGLIIKVNEIYVERDALETVSIERRKEIVSVAEKMSNAMIYDDVYNII